MDIDTLTVEDVLKLLWHSTEKMMRERDEARADVADLLVALRRIANNGFWKGGPYEGTIVRIARDAVAKVERKELLRLPPDQADALRKLVAEKRNG